MNWISCREKLPGVLQEVLATDGTKIRTVYRENWSVGQDMWIVCGSEDHQWGFKCIDATHWMPLPKLP